MREGYGSSSVSAILHFSERDAGNPGGFVKLLDSILNQAFLVQKIVVLNHDKSCLPQFDLQSSELVVLDCDILHLAAALNRGLQEITSDFIVYIDNSEADVELRRSYLETAALSVCKYPKLGLLYADYNRIENGQSQEIHLLKHHYGRLRDNQNYGKVFLFSTEALAGAGNFDETIRYQLLYDIRLKISEKFQIVHIANKYGGALYDVYERSRGHNVFDYLLAGKEVQVEAEKVLTGHLKRIGAYLKPGFNYHRRPDREEDYECIASVVIPVNHRPEFIGTALNSVFHQTIQNIEIIVVVNGGIKDPTIREVNKYLPGGSQYDQNQVPVSLVVSDINNIGLSLNLGIQRARGKYYIQLDSDDRLKPDAVEKVVALFESDPEIGIVIGSYEVWQKLDDGTFVRMDEIPVVTHDEWTDDNGRNNLLHINGAGAPRCIPIEIIKEMNYFGINDEPYARNYGEDYDMVMKISEKYKVGRIYDPIYDVVRHSGGTDHSINQETVDRNDEAKDYMRLLALQRRIQLNRR